MKSLITISGESEYSASELTFSFQSNEFSGKSSAWFAKARVEEFSNALDQYPLSTDSPHVLLGGYWSPDGKSLVQEHVAIVVTPKGNRGGVQLLMRLAAPDDQGGEEATPLYSACMRLEVSYSDIGILANALRKAVIGDFAEASIELVGG